MNLDLPSKEDDTRVRLMGIINFTPDSFYPESRVASIDSALKSMKRYVEEGADYIDIGAESSRPGADSLSAEAELARLLPVLKVLVQECPVPVSVDTCKAHVAEQALNTGVSLINDISGLRDPQMARAIARYQAGVVIMHMQGTPQDMQENPCYQNVTEEVLEYLKKAVAHAEDAGIASKKIVIDPGIGFGKTLEYNLQLIRELDRFRLLGKPILLGVSRKSFIGKLMQEESGDRLEGSIAAALVGVMNGARILRVHDVAATRRALDVAEPLLEQRKKS